MTEEAPPYGPPYQRISEICTTALAETTRTAPALFDVITGRLAAAGIMIERKETAKARTEHPNLVAVVQLQQEAEYLDYILLEGEEFNVYPYDGEVLATLISEEDALNFEPPLDPADLVHLRFVNRDGKKFYDENDVCLAGERKNREREAKRAAQRVLTIELPDEFLELCEEVKTPPAAVLRGFIADLCDLRSGDYHTNGSDERDLAERYFERCGYRFMAKWNREEAAGTPEEVKAGLGGCR